jgi:putative ABC transport system permease protein
MTRMPLADFGRDAGLALRLLARRPTFAAVALLTLALGIGAPTAIFSVVRAVLWRPLPYPDAGRLVQFRIEGQGLGGHITLDALPTTMATEWGANSALLEGMALFNDRALTLSTPDGPFRLRGISATANLFELLGVRTVVGTTFDAATTDRHQIVLSHAAWRRYFTGDRAIVGSAIRLDGETYRLVGVMPESFAFPTPETEFWVPLVIAPGGDRGMVLPVLGRMRRGATLAAVEQEGRDRLGPTGDPRRTQTLFGQTLQDQMVGSVRRILWVLFGAVVVVLVIATVNIALLLLTKGASREREFAVRLALGASRSRLVRQLFIEGLTLGALGGAAGLGVAWAGLKLLLRAAPADVPRLQETSLDAHVLLFAVVLTAGTSLMFGLLSAGRTLAVDPIRALGGRATETRLAGTVGPPRRRLNLLAAGELGLTMVLLVGAGLLVRSFVGLVLVDQGFTPRGALAMQVNLPASRYPSAPARLAAELRLLDEVARVPGATAAGLAVTMPNRQPTGRFDFSATELPAVHDPFSSPVADVHMVTEGFIEAMGLHLIAGRSFQSSDAAGAEEVVVISDQLARSQFPKTNPIGATLYSRTGNRRVIGVVGDVRPVAPGAESKPTAYLPLRQNSDVLEWFGSPTVIVRSADTARLIAPLRSLVLLLDPEMPPFNIRGLDAEVSQLVAGPRFSAAALGAFALVALVLASVGVYGVMAYSTGLRTREIGVRLALGASRGQVLRLMLKDGLLVLGAGLAAGFVAAIWLARTLTGLLHEVTPADPVALVSVAALLCLAGATAAFVPARRATRVSALESLRSE